jgi:hypothetical protein
VVASGLAAWLTAVASDEAAEPVLLLGIAGATATGAALFWPGALGLALVASGGAYAALLVIDEPTLDTRAAVVGAGLLVVGELVGWARELGGTTHDEPGGAWRRPVWIAGVAAGSLGLGWVLLALVDRLRVDGLAVEAVGALAALAVLLLVWRAATPRDVPD